MHFWIDKRSSYGIGHNRSMTAGMPYQHRRARSKSLAIQARQHAPSGSPQSVEPQRSTSQRTQEQSSTQNATPANLVRSLNAQHVPVIHSVYNRETLPVNHFVDSLESSRSNGLTNHWLPIYLKSGICIALTITLLALKLFYDNEIKVLHLILLGGALIVLLTLSILISTIRLRRAQNVTFTTTIMEPAEINQTTTQSILNELDEPPPYAIAVRLPEKHFNLHESPPPPYEKINII